MARIPKDTDYPVTVDGVGNFTFGRRTMRDEIAVQVEFARLIDGVEPTVWLQTVCGWIAALKVMTVRAPDGWDLDELDPFESETYEKLGRVHAALADKERSFRRGKNTMGQSGSAGTV